MVHSLRTLLAGRSPGFASLSVGLVALAPISHCRNHRPRCLGASYGSHSAAGAPTERSFSLASNCLGAFSLPKVWRTSVPQPGIQELEMRARCCAQNSWLERREF